MSDHSRVRHGEGTWVHHRVKDHQAVQEIDKPRRGAKFCKKHKVHSWKGSGWSSCQQSIWRSACKVLHRMGWSRAIAIVQNWGFLERQMAGGGGGGTSMLLLRHNPGLLRTFHKHGFLGVDTPSRMHRHGLTGADPRVWGGLVGRGHGELALSVLGVGRPSLGHRFGCGCWVAD